VFYSVKLFAENCLGHPNGFSSRIVYCECERQRQRLAIARALYREPEILILDEATSSLDSGAEEYIYRAIAYLREQGKTIILIAQSLSTVVSADKIAVLNNGVLIEEGKHEELIQRQSAYAAMWQKQFPMLDKTGI